MQDNKRSRTDSYDLTVKPEDEMVSSIENHIYFCGTVTEISINKLVKLINKKNIEYKKEMEKTKKPDSEFYEYKIEPKIIYLHITSFGGSLLASMSAIDAIENSTIPIYTIVEGYAASAGTLISIHGKKRFMTKNSYMLIHQLTSGISGQMNKIEDNFHNCKSFMDRIKKLYITKTKLKDDELDNILRHDSWWDFDKCLDKGLVDDVFINK
jgi:ATP-dependent protease ClpP protease subunit